MRYQTSQKRLNSVGNTYLIFNKEGAKVGWIKFIKCIGSHQWLIEDLGGNIPVSKVDYSASSAKDRLDKAGYSWQKGESKASYLWD